MNQTDNSGSRSLMFVFYLCALLLIIAPFYASGKTPIARMTLESIGLVLLFVVFWFGLSRAKTHSIVSAYVLISVGLACLYLVPIPFEYWVQLPGRELYVNVYEWLIGQGVAVENYQLSVIPYETTLALLALLPMLGIFYGTLSLSDEQVDRLVFLLLVVAGIQAIIGLIQYASGNPSFYFGLTPSGSAQGTYLNRDHFVALLEMTLPIAIGFMLYSIGRNQHDRRRNSSSTTLNQVLIYGSLALVILLAGIFTRSRAGVLLIMVAVLLSCIIFSRHIGGKQSVGLAAIFSTISVGVALSIGLIPVLNRFIATNPVEDERFRIFKHTLEGFNAFFPFGSGPGTFSDVYRAFQPIEQLRFINNAHNDYFELLFEMGVFGSGIIVGFLCLYLFACYRLRNRIWNRMQFIQVAAAIGVFLILLHSLADFNLHTPANAIVFCFLLGVLFRREGNIKKR